MDRFVEAWSVDTAQPDATFPSAEDGAGVMGEVVAVWKGWPLPTPGTGVKLITRPGYQQRGRRRMDRKPGVGVGKVHSFSLKGHLRHRDPCLLDVFL